MIITRHRRPVAAVVSFQRLTELTELEGDLRDLALVLSRAATDSGRRTSLDDVLAALAELRAGMRAFVDEREWGRFHDPKSVLLALVGEVGELAELLQWLPADEVRALAGQQPLRTRVGEELADVLLYLVLLADVLDLDLGAAAEAKLAAAHTRYPAAEVAGRRPDREV